MKQNIRKHYPTPEPTAPPLDGEPFVNAETIAAFYGISSRYVNKLACKKLSQACKSRPSAAAFPPRLWPMHWGYLSHRA